MVHHKGHKSSRLCNVRFTQQKVILYSLNNYDSMETQQVRFITVSSSHRVRCLEERRFKKILITAEVLVKVQLIFNIKKNPCRKKMHRASKSCHAQCFSLKFGWHCVENLDKCKD